MSTSRWRLAARRIIEDVLGHLPPTASFKDCRAALRAAYPWGERRMLPYRMWCSEQRAALERRFPQGAEGSKEQVAVTRSGIRCVWCTVRPAPGRPANPLGTGCMCCTAARTEWAAGAEAIVLGFALDAPPGVIADYLDEKGYEECARLLRKEMV